jgi:hypothetical protein
MCTASATLLWWCSVYAYTERGLAEARTRPSARAIPLPSQLRAIFLIALLLMAPLVFYFTTEGTWHLKRERFEGAWNSHFFMAQAHAMTHGRLDVDREMIHSECWERDSRCYGYFGITPSVLRLPVLGILRKVRSAMTPLYLGVAVLLGYWAALRLLGRAVVIFSLPARGAPPPLARAAALVPRQAREDPEPRRRVEDSLSSRGLSISYAAAGALALGPGGTLMFLTRAGVYEEAAAWGVAFILLALDRVWAWQQSRSNRSLVAAIVFAVAAANARPTAATASLGLGLLVAGLALWRFRESPGDSNRRRPVLVAALCLALLPGLTAAGVFWLKFRTPFPDLRLNEQVPENPWWRDILHTNGEHTKGLEFLPTEVVAYFRPDAVSIHHDWPYFDFRFPPDDILWVPPLHPGGAYVERFTSLSTSMPLPWAVNLSVAGWLGIVGWRLMKARPRSPSSRLPMLTREQWVLAAGSLAAATAMVVLTLTTVGITNRYLSDFFPISVVGLALGAGVVIPFLRGRPILMAVAALTAVLLIGWSVLLTLALNTRLVF